MAGPPQEKICLTRKSLLSKNPTTRMTPLAPISGDGPAPQAATGKDEYIQPTLQHGLRIWWAFYWRNEVISLILSLQLGAFVQWLITKGWAPYTYRALLIQGGSILLNYIPAVAVLYYVFKKKFRSFRIRLTPLQLVESEQELTLTPKRALRIWWTFTWRGIVYTVVLIFITNIPVGFIVSAVTAISPPVGQVFGLLMGIGMAAAVGLFVIYSNLLDEDIGDFHVGLVSRSALKQVPLPAIAASPGTVGPTASPGA
jgi:hypothetical protein